MVYRNLNSYLRETFGTKVYKISLSSGCSCPNRDGKISYGGCTFCSEGGSGDFAEAFADIDVQIENAKKRVESKFPKKISESERKYIAYFQSFTNTYAPVEYLRKIFTRAIRNEDVAVLSIGTRPDCLGDDVLGLLSELNRIKPVWIELGLQTVHEETAVRINRGYSLEVFESSYKKLKSLGITVVVHVILGLPGETRDQMLKTVKYLSGLTPVLDGIKLQMLHILEGTVMGEDYRKNPFKVFGLDEYCATVADCLSLLPEETVVHRITGDGPKKLLIAPLWSADKKKVLNTLNKYISSR